MARRKTSGKIPIQRRVHLFERLYADLKAYKRAPDYYEA